jgi:hypothetical protein
MKKISYLVLIIILSLVMNVKATGFDTEYVKVLGGDLNHDGKLDSNDLTIASNVLVKNTTLTSAETIAGDVDQGEGLTSADQVKIARMEKGMINQDYIYIPLIVEGASAYLLNDSELNNQGLYKKITITNPTFKDKILIDNTGKENIESKSYVKIYKGDANHDGQISTEEANIPLNIYVGNDSTDNYISGLFDVNNDNNVDSFDSKKLLQMVDGTIPKETMYVSLNENGASAYLLNNSELNKQGLYTITNPSYTEISTTNLGIFATTDDYGTSYYYRGATDNNWVNFAGFYWRIIRINGDGSIRMIYSGTTAPTSTTSIVMTGEKTNNYAMVYNIKYNSAEYGGYMYTLNKQHGFDEESSIKKSIDSWYDTTFPEQYKNYLADSNYCNDRTSFSDVNGTTTSTGIGSNIQYYGSYIRNVTNKTPSLICPLKEDSFNVSDLDFGNAKLKNPIGIISSDEIILAGGLYNTNNTNYYLYTNQAYWTISPSDFNTSNYFFNVDENGQLKNSFAANVFGVRPVINLKANISVTGLGTYDDPFIPKELAQEQIDITNNTSSEVKNTNTGTSIPMLIILFLSTIAITIILTIKKDKRINKI